MERIDNMMYFRNINSIGGVESVFYYIAKKYRERDIVIYYKTGDREQIKRLRRYVRVRRYREGEEIECRRAYFNYSTDIIGKVKAEEYVEIVHGNYKKLGKVIKINGRIDRYIGVSKEVCRSFEEATGKKCELMYNPVEVDEPRGVLKLVSATRLTKEKRKVENGENGKGVR